MGENTEFFNKVGTETDNKRRLKSRAINDEPVAATASVPKESLLQSSAAFKGEAFRRWAANGDVYWAANQTYDSLPSGLYRCSSADGIGPILRLMATDTDSLLELQDSPTIEVLDEIKKFWTLKDNFLQHGFLFKRGVLLWGPPGSGKTSTIQQLIKVIVEKYNGIAVYVENAELGSACLQMTRRVEPERPIIALMEDLDAMVERYGEQEYLSMLDGEAQVNNIVFVATTNYPERLDARFVDRPSRFDTIKYIGMPSPEARRDYFQKKNPRLKGDELEKWVENTQGFSIAHMRELIILCECYQKSFEEAVSRLDEMQQRTANSSTVDENGKPKQVGFRVVR